MRMVNFFKENAYIIGKCILNQVGLTIFGFMLAMAVGQNTSLQLITGIFAALFYLFLQYTMIWTVGVKEKDKVANKRMPYQPYKGAYISIIANLINFLFGLLMMIGQFFDFDNIYTIGNIISKTIQAMYLGISRSLLIEFESIFFFLTPILTIVTCGLAYYLGLKDKRILKLFGIDTTKSKKNN